MKSLPKIYKSQDVIVSEDFFPIPEQYPPKEVELVEVGVSEEQMEKDAQAQIIAEEMIKRATEQADRLVQEAMEQAEHERELMLSQAQKDGEIIRQQAYALGMTEGVKAEADRIRTCIADIELAISRVEGEQSGFMVDFENNLKWLSLEIASKVLHKKIAQDDTEMVDLVKAAVETVKNAEWITVEVSENMTGLISALEHELRKGTISASVDILGHFVPDGTCIVNTPDGIIDASIFTQLDNLKEYFSSEDNQ